jgi:butyryl-CoA dehydrogenase
MPLDFTLSEEQLQLRADARKFADEVLTGVAPAIADISDAGKCFDATKPFYQQMVDAGFQKLLIPPEYGGSEFSSLAFALATEELARVDVNVPTTLLVTGLGVLPIIRLGTPEQKERWLPRFTDDQPRLAAWAFSEVTGGANYDSTDPTFGAQTFALRDGDSWVINGAKQFISNGALPGSIVFFAVTDPDAGKRGISCFVAAKDTPGYKVLRVEQKLGQKASDTCALAFEDMELPADQLVGAEGQGYRIALSTLESGRIGIAAQSIGMARAALEFAIGYARERQAFGKPIIEHQAVAFRLVEAKTRLEAARQLTMHAARLKAEGKPALEAAAMAKLFASEAAEQICTTAIQTLGGYGFLADFPVERIYRDVRVCQIYEGTSDVQKIILQRML